MFVEKFEPVVTGLDLITSGIGYYDTYEEANDAAIVYASKDLPKERIRSYFIRKIYINEALRYRS